MSHPTALISRTLVDEFCAWRDCEELADHPDHPLCEQHYRRIGMLFIHEHIDVVRQVAGAPTLDVMIRRLADEGRDRRLLMEQQALYERAERRARGVVYYVQMGDLIKIGTTQDLAARLQALYVTEDDVLATEPGGRDVELDRHRQFADERVRRESIRAIRSSPRAHRVAPGLTRMPGDRCARVLVRPEGGPVDWLDDADQQPESWGVGAVVIERRGAEVAVVTSGLDAGLEPEGHAVLLGKRDALGVAWLLVRAVIFGR